MTEEQVYSYALTQIEGVGNVIAHRLWCEVGSASALFLQPEIWQKINPVLYKKIAKQLHDKRLIEEARDICRRAEDKGLSLMCLSDEDYPERLKVCDDAPMLLFFVGNRVRLHAPHIISVVGTRNADRYGKELTSVLIKQLAQEVPELVVISGLAYGIDISAHKVALELGLATFGVVGHGLDRIYPSVHRNTAIEMLQSGGLLSEFTIGSKPDRFNFVSRNRIVAALSEATLVVQSASRGGALITAHLAQNYNRTVFSVPGRITDPLFEGCNRLIADNIAHPALSGEEIARLLEWKSNISPKHSSGTDVQPQDLFDTLEPVARRINDFIVVHSGATVDELCFSLGMSVADISVELFNLEMQNLVQAGPGGIYISKV